MQTVNLGGAGLKVTRICFGCMSYGTKPWADWVLGEDDARPFFGRAWEAGINFFDTADVYSFGTSEEVLGRALRALAIPREQVVIATKVNGAMGPSPNERGLSAKHIRHAIDASLKRLQVDYVDLYQIHRFDPTVPVEETLGALDAVVRSGKALHIGASSMHAWQMAKMLDASERLGLVRFVTMQNHYNLIYREEEREMIPCCIDQGLAIIPWSPMARGFFSGDHRQGDWGDTPRAKTDAYAQEMYYRPEDFTVADRVQEVAKTRGVTGPQIALAWVLNKPHITAPIIGASRMEHLEQAIAAVDIKLSDAETKRLEEPYQLHPVLGHS
jgi:1-deoxyxylulose-5-phosphate synthase